MPTLVRWMLVLAALGVANGCARTSLRAAPAPASVNERTERPDSLVPARRGSLRVDSMWAPALGVTKRIGVWLPPSYASAHTRRYPVAYYLHGMWGSERDWADQGRIAHVADSLIELGMPEMIIVLPDGDNGYYTDWATPGNGVECRRAPPVPEPAADYCVDTPRYERYLATDVVTWVDSAFRTLPSADHRAIAGLSMGGYGAVSLALRHPDVWSAAASHSGVLSLLDPRSTAGEPRSPPTIEELERAWGPRFWPLIVPVFGRDTADWWAREPARLAARRGSSGRPLPALFIDVGTSDALVLGGNRHFRDEMRRLGVGIEYREWPGGHTWSYWRAHLPESLRWLAGHITPR